MKRKFESGAQKRQRKKKEQELIQSQKDAMYKFIKRNKEDEIVNPPIENEQLEGNDEHKLDDIETIRENDEIEHELDDNERIRQNDKIEHVLPSIEPNESAELNENRKINLNSAEVSSFEENPGEPSNTLLADIYDPGQWNNVDIKLRDLLVEKGPVREIGLKYPVGEKSRRFSIRHYTQIAPNGEKFDRKWLVYSKHCDKVFCFCCKLFSKSKKSQLSNEGCKDWRNISLKLKRHENSTGHAKNMLLWIDLKQRLLNNKTIDKDIQEQIDKEKKHWKNVLVRIIAVIKTISKNNMAFRGSNEKLYEENNGIFLSIIEMIAEFDLVMQEHVRRIKQGVINNHYLGHIIQNELIQLLATEVRNFIITKLREAKYFSVILDCTPDISHHEQMTLVLRFVNVSISPVQIEEYFLDFIKVDDTSGKGLFEELIKVLELFNLDINDVRGQGYDNGSNMKGKQQGVQKRLLDLNPRAFYTPCGCHSLNLVISDMASSCIKAVSFFGVVQRIYCLFSSSTKRWKIFTDNVKKLTVKTLSITRWESREESVRAIRYQAPEIRDALLELANSSDDPKVKSEAESLAIHDIGNYEFLLGMVIWYEILFSVNLVSKSLQSKKMHIDGAISELKGLVTFFEKFRENGFEKSIDIAKCIAREMNVEPIFHERRIIRRKKQFDESADNEVTQSPEESFRTTYFLCIVDQALSSIRNRFEQLKSYEEMFGFLFDIKRLKLLDDDDLKQSCLNLEQFLKHGEHSDIEGIDLFGELKVLREALPTGTQSALQVLDYLNKIESFPNSYISYRILLTVPVTVASAERSFSKLKLIKSYLRSTMSQERLSGLAILSIEKKILENLEYKNLINKFASQKARKVKFT